MSKIVLFIYLLSLSSYFQFIIFNHVSSQNETPFFPFYLYFILILCLPNFYPPPSGTSPYEITKSKISPSSIHFIIQAKQEGECLDSPLYGSSDLN